MSNVQKTPLESIEEISQNQEIFQEMANMPIRDELQKIHLSEVYIFKAIEELVELRKTIPSSFNKVEKNPAKFDREKMKGELSDVILFLVNFCLIWDLDIAELIEAVRSTQLANFDKLANSIANRNNKMEL